MSTKNLLGLESLESKFGPMTVGLFLKAFREADGVSAQLLPYFPNPGQSVCPRIANTKAFF